MVYYTVIGYDTPIEQAIQQSEKGDDACITNSVDSGEAETELEQLMLILSSCTIDRSI